MAHLSPLASPRPTQADHREYIILTEQTGHTTQVLHQGSTLDLRSNVNNCNQNCPLISCDIVEHAETLTFPLSFSNFFCMT